MVFLSVAHFQLSFQLSTTSAYDSDTSRSCCSLSHQGEELVTEAGRDKVSSAVSQF